MSAWFTPRRTLVSILGFIVVAAITGGVALRVANKAAAEAPGGPPVTLEFTSADVARVEPRQLTRWLPVSGTLQPVNQTTVKAKVSGEIRQVLAREGESVKAGQVLARLDTADLEAKLNDRIGALEASRAQRALAALGLAVIFIYLILASQFASFTQPLAIMASLPFSLIGVFLALLLTGPTLNIFSIIGFIMLMGLVTKNAILLVDFANRARREGAPLGEALARAGQVRLRPILMTTAAMIGGMLPLALGLGESGEEQAPMGRAIIGGVITSTLLTLVVVPVIYTFLVGWEARRKARRDARSAAPSSQPAPGD